MQISALSEELSQAALEFAWDQWAQMGLLANPRRWDSWSMDPEALTIFSLEVARRDPRLFDEILDWLVTNERIVSVQRLRNLATTPEDRALVGAALSWVSNQKRGSGPAPVGPDAAQTPLFYGLSSPRSDLDPAFAAEGFGKALTRPTGRSRAPDVDAPVNFAFQLRYLLGVGARAEVMRCLLTIDAPRVSAQVIARSAAYSKRNVQEALNSLRTAGVIIGMSVGGEHGYSLDRDRWARLLNRARSGFPTQRDWPQLLGALVRILRWLQDPGNEQLSEYMRASAARDLLDQLADDLAYAGVQHEVGGHGEDQWASFVSTAHNAMTALA